MLLTKSTEKVLNMLAHIVLNMLEQRRDHLGWNNLNY